jgi:hypothetical protein
MSSYFDAKQLEVDKAFECAKTRKHFCRRLVEIEEQVFRDVCRITGDREFPATLRERIMDACATERVDVGGVPNRRGLEQCIRFGWSHYIETMHSLFHEVAQSRTETRFGLLTDDPIGDAERRDHHDAELWRGVL